jgi:DNA-binding CsgD family transcriptional regulator
VGTVDRSSGGGLPPLLEREGELERLTELTDSAAAGEGRAAAVVGPAGIGKTSLLEAGREIAQQRGLACLTARGGELEQDFSFGVARQLFEHAVRDADEPERARLLEGAAGLAAPVIGLEGGSREPQGEAGFAFLHGLYWLCASMAESQPLALVVDDLHWADAASLRFLSYLGRRIDELPVLLLIATRPPVASQHGELVEQVIDERESIRLSPSPLSSGGVEELLHDQTGQELDSGLVAACHKASAGNPFLCVSIASALRDRDEPADPSSVEDLVRLDRAQGASMIVARLGRLPSEATELAQAVSILGTGAELRYAAELAGQSMERASEAADTLTDHGILRPGERLDFEHPLIRAAVREQMPSGRRGQLHLRAAQVLAAHAPPERVAPHLMAAPETGEGWVNEVLRSAASAAAAKGDPESAVPYLERALKGSPDPGTQIGILKELGMAQLAAGDAEAAVASLTRARGASDDAEERGGLARALALALTVPGRYEEAVAVLDQALTELPTADLQLVLEAQLHQGVLMAPGTYTKWRDGAAGWKREVGGRTPGERAFAAVLATEGMLRIEPAPAVREIAQRAFDGGLLDDAASFTPIWMNVAFPLLFAEGFELAQKFAERTVEDARRRGSPVGASRALTLSSMLRLRVGAIRHAIAEAREAIELGRQRGFMFSLLALGTLVEALLEAGELESAEQELEQSGMQGDVPELFIAGWVLQGRGRLRLAQGRLTEGIADLEELGRRGEQGWWPWNPGMYYYRSLIAGALAGADRDRALELAGEELELARRLDAPRAIGIALRAVGLAEGGEDGIERLRQSVDALRESRAQLELARSLVELGAAVRRGGQRRDAREPLQEGMELAHRCGAGALVDHALVELRATGARPRRVMRTGVEALTPSELRVAEMAASGMTNREIAQALFVTLRTVQVHLSHSFQKLDIDSREELANALE